jgi:hypothetical protein
VAGDHVSDGWEQDPGWRAPVAPLILGGADWQMTVHPPHPADPGPSREAVEAAGRLISEAKLLAARIGERAARAAAAGRRCRPPAWRFTQAQVRQIAWFLQQHRDPPWTPAPWVPSCGWYEPERGDDGTLAWTRRGPRAWPPAPGRELGPGG